MATVFIAVVAVLLAVWEGYESRQHNRVSVKPVLNSNTSKSYGDTQRVEISLGSVGLGPARITGFHVFYNGRIEKPFHIPGYQTHYHSIKQGVKGSLPKGTSITFSDQSLVNNQVILEGKTLKLFQMEVITPISDEEFRKAIATVEQTTDIFVCYYSLYDDQCAVEHLGNKPHLKPESCAID